MRAVPPWPGFDQTEDVGLKALARWFTMGIVVCGHAVYCASINVGDIFYISSTNGTTQFFLDNFTGVTDGCSTASGFPVCTNLLISGTLTYSYLTGLDVVNGSATLASAIDTNAANGGASYAPANFQLPSIDILSASFFGSLSPGNFSTDTGPFESDGLVFSEDLVNGGGFALLMTNDSVAAVPEPSPASLVALSGLVLAVLSRFRKRPLQVTRDRLR